MTPFSTNFSILKADFFLKPPTFFDWPEAMISPHEFDALDCPKLAEKKNKKPETIFTQRDKVDCVVRGL